MVRCWKAHEVAALPASLSVAPHASGTKQPGQALPRTIGIPDDCRSHRHRPGIARGPVLAHRQSPATQHPLGWAASLSLFLQHTASELQTQTLREKLLSWPEIEHIDLISPEQALSEFRELSGFGDALDALEENPLPAVLAVKPVAESTDSESISRLLERLRKLPEIELAQLDLQWVKRFNAIVDIVQRSIWVMATLLGLAVLLITGNTIRLEIQSRREEIEVTKLIGATNAFIRRPFLYSGLWYGAIGALLATLLVELAFLQLATPVGQLAGLYQSGFSLQTLAFSDTLLLLLSGTLLGLLGAWLAVGRHMSAIEPT